MNEPTPHPQAAQILEWAADMQKDASIVWQERIKGGTDWYDCQSLWDKNFIYRRKPAEKRYIERTVRYPEPLKVKPAFGEIYWIPTHERSAVKYRWGNDRLDNNCFSAGFCFATEADAIEYAEAVYGGGV